MTRPTGQSRRAILVAATVVALGALATAFVMLALPPSAALSVTSLETGSPTVHGATITGPVDAIGDASDTHTNEVQAALYYPASWSASPARVVLVQHGGHTPCQNSAQTWPCSDITDRTPSYLGYQYLAERLVADGFVVVSISANGTIGSAEVSLAPTVFNYYLDLLQSANDGDDGPFGELLTGRLDLASVDLIGHSRGGDAVARFTRSDAPVLPLVPVRRIVLLAPVVPVDFADTQHIAPIATPALVIIGTCDGDAGNDGVEYAHVLEDPASSVLTITGANHNFFNSQWTPGTGVPDAIDDAELLDDPACAPGSSTRLTASAQQGDVADAIAAFFG